MNKKQQIITGNVRARYTSPSMKIVKIHAQSRILDVSPGGASVEGYISGSDTDGGEMTENGYWGI